MRPADAAAGTIGRDWGEEVVGVVDGWLFDGAAGDLPAVMVVPLENPHLHDAKQWQAALGRPVSHHGLVDLYRRDGATVGVARPVLGAAGAAMLVDAASRRGVRKVVGVGFCGALRADFACGDPAVVARALVHDGVARAYADMLGGRDAVMASPELVAAADAALPRVTVCSVDAVHLETTALVTELARRDADCIDMEMSTLLTVAAVRGIAATGVLTVSDVPVRNRTADVPSLRAGSQRSLDAALSLAFALA